MEARVYKAKVEGREVRTPVFPQNGFYELHSEAKVRFMRDDGG